MMGTEDVADQYGSSVPMRPGTITSLRTRSVAYSGEALPITALAAVNTATAFTWHAMVLYASTSSVQKQGLVQGFSSRSVGRIVLAMGVPLVWTGEPAFTHMVTAD